MRGFWCQTRGFAPLSENWRKYDLDSSRTRLRRPRPLASLQPAAVSASASLFIGLACVVISKEEEEDERGRRGHLIHYTTTVYWRPRTNICYSILEHTLHAAAATVPPKTRSTRKQVAFREHTIECVLFPPSNCSHTFPPLLPSLLPFTIPVMLHVSNDIGGGGKQIGFLTISNELRTTTI